MRSNFLDPNQAQLIRSLGFIEPCIGCFFMEGGEWQFLTLSDQYSLPRVLVGRRMVDATFLDWIREVKKMEFVASPMRTQAKNWILQRFGVISTPVWHENEFFVKVRTATGETIISSPYESWVEAQEKELDFSLAQILAPKI